jgi:hypothetical protein
MNLGLGSALGGGEFWNVEFAKRSNPLGEDGIEEDEEETCTGLVGVEGREVMGNPGLKDGVLGLMRAGTGGEGVRE